MTPHKEMIERERPRFEKKMLESCLFSADFLTKRSNGAYVYHAAQARWEGWLARAEFSDGDGWVSVDERLPSDRQMVLVHGLYWNLETYPYRPAQVVSDDPKKWFDCPDVTHWREVWPPAKESEAKSG